MTIPSGETDSGTQPQGTENSGSSLSSIENGSSSTALSTKALMPDSSTGLDLQDIDLVDADEIAPTANTGKSFLKKLLHACF